MIYQYSGSSYEIKNKFFKKIFWRWNLLCFSMARWVFFEFPQEEILDLNMSP